MNAALDAVVIRDRDKQVESLPARDQCTAALTASFHILTSFQHPVRKPFTGERRRKPARLHEMAQFFPGLRACYLFGQPGCHQPVQNRRDRYFQVP